MSMGFFGNNNTDLILKGNQLFLQHQFEEALQYFDKATGQNPEDKDAWIGKGDSLKKLDKHEEAITCYDFAIRISSDDDTWTSKGSSLNILKKYEEADFCFVQALAINCENTLAIDMQKNNLEMQKNNHIQIFFDSAKISMNKAQELFKTKKFEDAIPYYEESIKQFSLITPDSELFTINDKQGFIEYLNSSISTCYYLIKKYEKSLTYVDKALLIDPINVDNLRIKSTLLSKLEKHEDALVTITEALKIDPNNKIIQKNLDSVKAKVSKDFSSKTADKMEVSEKLEPLDVLKMRLAKGEITLEEFNKIKEHLA